MAAPQRLRKAIVVSPTNSAEEDESQRLLAQWQSGDETARNKLLILYANLPERIAKKMWKNWKKPSDDGGVEDLVDVGMTAMFESTESLKKCAPNKVGAYFTKVIKNAIVYEIRSAKRRPKSSLDEIPENRGFLAPTTVIVTSSKRKRSCSLAALMTRISRSSNYLRSASRKLRLQLS